jgi:hypothetical protein
MIIRSLIVVIFCGIPFVIGCASHSSARSKTVIILSNHTNVDGSGEITGSRTITNIADDHHENTETCTEKQNFPTLKYPNKQPAQIDIRNDNGERITVKYDRETATVEIEEHK